MSTTWEQCGEYYPTAAKQASHTGTAYGTSSLFRCGWPGGRARTAGRWIARRGTSPQRARNEPARGEGRAPVSNMGTDCTTDDNVAPRAYGSGMPLASPGHAEGPTENGG